MHHELLRKSRAFRPRYGTENRGSGLSGQTDDCGNLRNPGWIQTGIYEKHDRGIEPGDSRDFAGGGSCDHHLHGTQFGAAAAEVAGTEGRQPIGNPRRPSGLRTGF